MSPSFEQWAVVALLLPAAAAYTLNPCAARHTPLAVGTAPLRVSLVRRMCVAAPVEAPLDSEDIIDELLDLVEDVEEVCDRGIGAPSDLAEDILEIIGELEGMCPVSSNWGNSPVLAGRWRLRYTSSKTFANNLGLTGYARDLAGVSTPATFMRVQTQFKRLVYEETLAFEKGSLAAMFGKFSNAETVQVECRWSETREGAMAVESQLVVVGSNSWQPADRQDKAVRALGAARPVYLDEELLVMRSQPDYIVWVFTKP